MLTPADLKDICAYVRHGQQDTLHSNDGRGYKRSSFIKKKIEILKFKKTFIPCMKWSITVCITMNK